MIKGYEFSRTTDVFDNYVKDISGFKKEATDSTNKNILKSLLNNLLGRFGINLEKSTTSIFNMEEFLHVKDI